jgi:SulP family sulfate permease
MGAANLISGFFGGMGGDAMIGLSTINCLNGGKGRLAPTVTALGVMLCTIVAYPVLDFIPIASLAGVMIVVVLHTFKWGKVPMILSAALPASWRKPINSMCQCKGFPKWMQLPEEVDRWEAVIIIVVSALTIAFNLVVGVGVGLVLACVRFAYCQSIHTNVVVAASEPGQAKRYALQGKLFFGSALRFHTFFDVDNDPDEVVLELPERPTEYSAVDALARVSNLYAAANKKLTIEVQVHDPEMQSSHRPAEAAPKLVNVVADDEPQVAVA